MITHLLNIGGGGGGGYKCSIKCMITCILDIGEL